MGYLGREVPPGKEENLIIHYWDGQTWEPLDTEVDTRRNSAVALVSGPGLYALMVRVVIPLDGPGWNVIAFPVVGTQPVIKALEPISKTYQILYRNDITDKSNPWHIHGPNLPSWFADLTDSVTNLEYGEVYYIYATEPVDWFVHSEGLINDISAGSSTLPPAVYYGTLPPTSQAGAIVTGSVNGTLCGEAEAKEVQTVNGPKIAFAIKISDDYTEKGCGTRGSTVTFQVGDTAIGNAPWDNTRVQEIELTIISN